MTLIDLSRLKISEQVDLLYKEGVFLSKRLLGNKTVILYHFYNVYAEIYYVKYRQIVDHINYTDDPKILEPYIDKISINEIFY